MLTASVPHRLRTAENPERVVPLVPQIVAYLCGACEATTEVRPHPQAPIPVLWQCRVCRDDAECAVEADEGVELIGMPATPKHYQRKDHWAHLSDRRTEAELERLLAKRLAPLRTGKLHSGPSHRSRAHALTSARELLRVRQGLRTSSRDGSSVTIASPPA